MAGTQPTRLCSQRLFTTGTTLVGCSHHAGLAGSGFLHLALIDKIHEFRCLGRQSSCRDQTCDLFALALCDSAHERILVGPGRPRSVCYNNPRLLTVDNVIAIDRQHDGGRELFAQHRSGDRHLVLLGLEGLAH